MKIILIMLQSLNGKITNGGVDDLSWGGKADKKHFSELTKEIGTVIMGSSNFEALGRRALPQRRNIVMTSDPSRYRDISIPGLEFTADKPDALVKRLEGQGLGSVALIGGGTLNTSFLRAGLIDEIYLSIAPIIFTKGVDLFANTDSLEPIQYQLELESVNKLDDETVLLHYIHKSW